MAVGRIEAAPNGTVAVPIEEARNAVIYVQDDDCIVENVEELYETFLADPTRIAHALAPTHYPSRKDDLYADCHCALVGWGAFFRREWADLLEDLPEHTRREPLFKREADRFFSILLERHHRTIPARVRMLEGHSTPGVALWVETGHRRASALAIREALRLVRLRRHPEKPAPWHVVVVCRNGGRFLREAVESVLANRADFELTIVDDGSTDETTLVVDGLAQRYPRIGTIRNPTPRGAASARNSAIDAVDSFWVTLLDANDRMGPSFLSAAAAVLESGSDVANPDAILFDEGSGRWVVPNEVTLPMLLRRNQVHYVAAFRRAWWAEVGGFGEDLVDLDDYDFWIRIAAAGANIRAVHGDHFFHRRRADEPSTKVGVGRGERVAEMRIQYGAVLESP